MCGAGTAFDAIRDKSPAIAVYVRRPFPDVSHHVMQPVGIRGKAADRCTSRKTVLGAVLQWEKPLPEIRQRMALCIAERPVRYLIGTSGLGRVFPLGLRR